MSFIHINRYNIYNYIIYENLDREIFGEVLISYAHIPVLFVSIFLYFELFVLVCYSLLFVVVLTTWLATKLSTEHSLNTNMNKFSVDKKNQLDVTFCILYFSSNSCSTCFGQPCAHHQALTTADRIQCGQEKPTRCHFLYSLFLF